MWTIGHVVYPHVVDVYSKYGVGLAIASMEGREAKHIAISRYSKNTSYRLRWTQIFRHEFISLIWLREREGTMLVVILLLRIVILLNV